MSRKPKSTTNDLLALPANLGRTLAEAGAVIACPLLGTDKFVKFCKERGLAINRERLIRLERLGLFAPVFRVQTPSKNTQQLSLPPRERNNWFSKKWAWDTTGIGAKYKVPDHKDRTQEGYYSIFQIDYLHLVLLEMTLPIHMDGFLDHENPEEVDWTKNGDRWLKLAQECAASLGIHEYRRSVALLCQFISDRYYPQTQGDQRTIQVPQKHYSDQWITVNALDWDWHECVRQWSPRTAERLFKLTPEKLSHAFRGLAVAQARCDPLERWYQLTQFVSVRERARLKDTALRAETLRSAAHMLRLLYKDLYDEELPHPNEVTGTVITHVPELTIRKDTRRYLEFVVNRFGINPQPKVCLILEGPSEEVAVVKIFEEYFGAHPGKYGIELVSLGGVDFATGGKADRFRAILRLIDYLHHHQTLTFLILDNEGYAARLKSEAKKAKSIHHRRRHITRPEYIRIWQASYEFDSFSDSEIAAAMSALAGGVARFASAEVAPIRKEKSTPGAPRLEDLYHQKTGHDLNKPQLSEALVEAILSPKSRRRIESRPLVKTLERVARLAMRNPLPTMQKVWEKNQASKYLGKRRH